MSTTERIDKYLSGELSPEEKLVFEKELSTNPALKAEYESQLSLTKGAERMGLQKQVQQGFRKAKLRKKLIRTATTTAVAIAVAGAIFLTAKVLSNKQKEHLEYELNEQGNTNWSQADKNLEAQLFHINPSRDTIIESEGGIVVAIPAEAFVDKFGESPAGPVDIELKEALTPLDIMKAGLNTLSDGRLLETGGMFYLNTRKGTENLSINQSKPLSANIPAGDRNDMMLFEGERKTNGSINWTKPRPLKKQLSTVDILSLNFYPPHFLDSLAAWGFDVKNKKLTDSIYYAQACAGAMTELPTGPSDDIAFKKDSARTPTMSVAPPKDGAKLFKQNCAVCHTLTDQVLTGPGLAGVENRVPKPAREWLRAYILDNKQVIKSGDPYAAKLFNENRGADMTVFKGQLSDQDVDALITHIIKSNPWKLDACGNSECPAIDPIKIHAIWDRKFNQTILATREFETRLQSIFKTCSHCVLNAYINNLDKNMYELDSVAATLSSGEEKAKFLEFYKRRDGGVDISTEQAKKLQAYFSERQETYRKAAQMAREKLLQEESVQAKLANQKRNAHTTEAAIRSNTLFNEEYTKNLKEAYRQLGKPFNPTPPPVNYVSGTVLTMGWKNVDAYVAESTLKRSTLDYTDPESGKKAVIRYEPLQVTISNVSDYDRTVAYMIPDSLSSFQLMKQQDASVYKENLNELLNYSIIVMGFKGDKIYFGEIKQAKPEAYTLSLNETEEETLKALLNSRFPLRKGNDLMRELDYQQFEQKEIARHQKIRDRKILEQKIRRVIFPCMQGPERSDILDEDFEN